jgi:hypothetical protein
MVDPPGESVDSDGVEAEPVERPDFVVGVGGQELQRDLSQVLVGELLFVRYHVSLLVMVEVVRAGC